MAAQYGEWSELNDYGKHMKYRCDKCDRNVAEMFVRMVHEEDSSHKEYKIVCPLCGRKTQVHWSKNLTAMEWNGSQDEIDILKPKKRPPTL